MIRFLIAILLLLMFPATVGADRPIVRHTQVDSRTGTLLRDTGRLDLPVGKRYDEWVAAGRWTFTKSRKSHFGICRTKQNDFSERITRTGSGVLVWSDGKRGFVLTANHSVPNNDPVLCHWPSGKRYGTVARRDTAADIAMIMLDDVPRDAIVVPVDMGSTPKPGGYVEICGYGAQVSDIRTFWGLIRTDTTYDVQIVANAYIVHGDSGGPMLQRDRVVGVALGGTREKAVQTTNGPIAIIYPACGCGPGPIRRMLRCMFRNRCMPRVYPVIPIPVQQCAPMGAPVPMLVPSQQRPQTIINNNVPQPLQPLPTKQPEQKPDPKPDGPVTAEIEIDYNKLADLVYERMANNPEHFRGPPGEKGDNGNPGGTPEIDYAVLSDRIYEKISENADQFRGPPGLPGAPTTIGLLDGDGNVVMTISPDTSGQINLPPVRMQIKQIDGSTDQQAKPLGEHIRVKLVPIDAQKQPKPDPKPDAEPGPTGASGDLPPPIGAQKIENLGSQNDEKPAQ